MNILCWTIFIIGLYLIGRNEYKQELKRNKNQLEYETFHVIEQRIKKLHNHGQVFNEEHIL